MARIDSLFEFADAADLTNAAGTYNLTNQIDMQQIRELGDTLLWLVINVDTAIVTGGTASTLTFRLVSDDTASISTTTCSVHYQTPAFVVDDDPTIPAGRQLFACPLPVTKDYVSRSVAGVDVTTGPGARYERYLGVQYIIGAAAAITAGKVNAFLTARPNSWRAYADASN